MKQTKTQQVFFQNAGQWFKNNLDLETLYNDVHSAKCGYGTSANQLVNEMMANVLELICQGYIDISKPFTITDYGCGQSKASNVLAKVICSRVDTIIQMLASDCSYGEVLEYLAPIIVAADSEKVDHLDQITKYGHITVQRYDIGIPEFAKPLTVKADIVFCNDVFEHIPTEDLPAFIEDLENAGEYVIASISLRDAVNYSKIPADVLLNGAEQVECKPESGIVLEQEESGDYIFSLHVSIMPQDKWQQILTEKWTLMPAQDYTACSAMNFKPSEEYKSYKRTLISQIGFADFIPFPTPVGSKYEQDPVLFVRTAKMQPQKHLYKLNALEHYEDSEFKRAELAKTEAFFKFIEAKVRKNEESGLWEFEDLPVDFLEKLYILEHLSKATVNNNDQAEVDKNADVIIAKYNSDDESVKMIIEALFIFLYI
jgi:hypothetical protein